jgi:hypothetical protein
MKLYLVERTDRCDWDEYDSYVVAANNEQEATGESYQHYQSWHPSFTKITEVGVANENVEGIVLASFNAG